MRKGCNQPPQRGQTACDDTASAPASAAILYVPAICNHNEGGHGIGLTQLLTARHAAERRRRRRWQHRQRARRQRWCHASSPDGKKSRAACKVGMRHGLRRRLPRVAASSAEPATGRPRCVCGGTRFHTPRVGYMGRGVHREGKGGMRHAPGLAAGPGAAQEAMLLRQERPLVNGLLQS